MKKGLLFIALLVCAIGSSFAQDIYTYGSLTSGAPDFVDPNATASSLTAIGTGSNTPCGSGFSGITGFTGGSYSSSGPCVQVQMTANVGYTINVTGFSAGIRRSNTGPTETRWAYSIDGSTWIDEGSDNVPGAGNCGTIINYSWPATFTNTVIYFRIYPYAAGGGSGTFQILGLHIMGTVTPVTTCVPPTLSATPTDATCNGANDASIDLTTTGGTSPFTYAWTGPGTYTNNTQDISGLAPGTYTVVVTATGGCTSTTTATVSEPALITASATSDAPICSGYTITLTGSSNTAGVSYSWTGPNGYTASTQVATVPNIPLSGAGDYTVTAHLGACSSAPATTTVTLIPSPDVTITGTTAICSGNATTITFTGTPNDIVTFTVNGGAPQQITIDGTGTATLNTGLLTVTTIYDVVNITDGGNGCIHTYSGNSATVTINQLPAATISGTSTICSGTNAFISFTGTPNAIVSYTVNGGATQTVTLDGAGNAIVNTGSISADATYLITGVLNPATACSQNITGQSATVTVLALPTASVSAAATDVCSGSNTDILFSGTPNATITYTINGGAPQTVTLDGTGNATVNTGAIAATASYDLITVALSGTPSCPQAISANVTVTIDPLPVVTLSGTAVVCSGDSALLTFTGTPNATVDYTINNGPVQTILLDGTGTGLFVTGPVFGLNVYNVVSVTDGTTGCSQTIAGQSATVSINPLPFASITGTTAICDGTGTTITFNGTPGATLTYNIDGGADQNIILNGSGIATLPTGTLSATTTYNLTLVVAGITGCFQPISGQSAIVTVNPLPTATVSGTTTVCSGDVSVITFNGTPDAIVTYTVDGGSPQNITLDNTGTNTLGVGPLTAATTISLTFVNNTGTGCSQPVSGQNATVSVNPLPAAAIGGGTTICSGDNTNITFTGTPDAVVTYNINGGPAQTITLDGTGNASVNTGALTATTSYFLVSVQNITTGCTLSFTGTDATITVNPLPTAAISGAATICNTSPAILTFTGTPNATVTYSANGGAPQSTTLNPAGFSNVSVTPSVTTSYDLIDATTVSGCTQAQTDTVVITVNPLPVVTISGTTAVCLGNSADVLFTGAPGTTFTYSETGGITQTITFDATGQYTITLIPIVTTTVTLVNGSTPLGCTANLSGSATVTVNPLPTANISGDATICQGTSDFAIMLFTGTPNSVVTYSVNGGANQNIALNILGYSSLNVNPSVTSVYSLVSATSAAGCPQTATGDATVTVNPTPVASISADVTLCTPGIVPIIFTGTPGATVSYTRDNNPAQIATLDATGHDTLHANISATTTYYLQGVASSNGCAQNLAGSMTITVLPALVAAISAPMEICSSSSATLMFSGTPDATITYTANGGAPQTVTLDGAGNAAVIATPNVTTTYLLTNVSSTVTGCTEPANAAAMVVVDDFPTVNITGATAICDGSIASVVFTGTSGAVVTYTINGGSNQTIDLDATGTATLLISPSGSVTYSLVSVSTFAGCTQTATGSITIDVNATPSAEIFGSTTIFVGDSTLIAFVGTANGEIIYSANGVQDTIHLNASGVGSIIVSPMVTTTYALVSMIGSNGCVLPITGSATVTTYNLGVTTVSSGNSLSVSIYPNPANGHAVISYNCDARGETTLRVMNIAGQEIYAKNMGMQQAGEATIPMQDMPAGVYIVEFKCGENTATKRLVKE